MLAERRLDSKSCYRGLTRFGAARLVRAGDGPALQLFFVGQLDPELAELLQIDDKTVRALAAKGELPGRKLGRHWRFSRQAVLDWLATPERKRRAAGFEG